MSINLKLIFSINKFFGTSMKYSNFQQHFMSSFSDDILSPKHYKAKEKKG